MGIRQPIESTTPPPDPIPWPDGAATCSIPGLSYTLRDSGRFLNGSQVRYLGFGGEGFVYLATSPEDRFRGCSLAIKFLMFPKQEGETEKQRKERLDRFMAQASCICSIGSFRLAHTRDLRDLRCLGPAWPPVAMVMDFFPCSLQDVVEAATSPLPLRLAVSWAKQIADGLQELHEDRDSRVHRDIKPSNIMFRLHEGAKWAHRAEDLNDADAMITDFGTLGRCGEASDLVVFRQDENDPYKHPDFYPLRCQGCPPSSPQTCDPYMDIYAYGEVLRVLDALTRERLQ